MWQHGSPGVRRAQPPSSLVSPPLHAAVTQKPLWINQMGSALQTARVLWVTAVIRGNRSCMALGCGGCKCAQCPAYPSDAAWRHSGAVGQDLPALPSPFLCPADAVLESFDNHPPIVLPSAGFKVDLEVETLDDNIYRHLLYVRHFLWSLQSKSPQGSEGPCSAPPKVREPFFSQGAVRCCNKGVVGSPSLVVFQNRVDVALNWFGVVVGLVLGISEVFSHQESPPVLGMLKATTATNLSSAQTAQVSMAG